MKRSELAHILRAASRIAGETDIVVFGSQSILGSFDEDDLPDAAVGSVEADVTFWGDARDEKADMVDEAIGEGSDFHQMYGYYAQGVSITTAKLPADWKDRVVVFQNFSSDPGRGICLEPHDLVVSKLVAGREKDLVFAAALLDAGLIQASTDGASSHPRRAARRHPPHRPVDRVVGAPLPAMTLAALDGAVRSDRGTASGACGHLSPPPLVVSQPDR